MSNDTPDHRILDQLVPHIFLPPKLPQQAQTEEDERATSLLLCKILKESALRYQEHVVHEQRGQWDVIARMLDSVSGFVGVPMNAASLSASLTSMISGDIFALHIRSQNAAVIVRRGDHATSFEVFEASSSNEAVYSTPGKLLITYPGPAVSVPNLLASTQGFCDNTALFLSSMNADILDAAPVTKKAGSTVKEVRDTTDPKYISELFIGILHGCPDSSSPDVRRITKHIADEVMWHKTFKPWRRLPLWLILRVTLQTTLSDTDYKAFMVLFMAQLLECCVQVEHTRSSDLIFTMQSKIVRRLAKLAVSAPDFVISAVSTVTQRAKDIMDTRWAAVQITQSQCAPWDSPSTTQVGADTRLKLKNALPYITLALSRCAGDSGSRPPAPTHARRVQGITDFHVFKDGLLAAALTRSSPRLVLADFEECVRLHLDDWILTIPSGKDAASVQSRDLASETLLSCFTQYLNGTKSFYYKDHPEDQSISAITLLSLWCALDCVTLTEHPLLQDYSPEIPIDFFEPLVLRDHGHIHLANDLEVYIRQRHEHVRAGSASVFDVSSSSSSFALRTFAERPDLPALKASIEDRAHRERELKVKELERLNDLHRDLKAQVAGLSCTYVPAPRKYYNGMWQDVPETIHAASCGRCKLEKKANSLSIAVHEWPLPADEGMAKFTVFELGCPPVFSRWRDATYLVLTSVGKPSTDPSTAAPYITLRKYDSLSSAYAARASPFVMASDAKPFSSSHYRLTKIPAKESMVCVNNGLRPWIFHATDYIRLSHDLVASSSVAHLCIQKLASGSPYYHLQAAVTSTLHTSNDVIADQASCPKGLSLHEHISFASFRAGGRVQWLNLLRELKARELTFNAPEVYLLITQSMWQLGPFLPDSHCREWHRDLEETSFCMTVLRELRLLLVSVGENWNEISSVRLIVSIAIRILEASPSLSVTQEARAVLQGARSLASVLRDKLHERLQLVSASNLSSTQRLVCEASAVCTMTYDVSDFHLLSLLTTPDDVYELVRSVILVQENSPGRESEVAPYGHPLLHWHERILQRLEPHLRARIIEDPRGMHRAMASIWPSYPSDSQWSALPGNNARQLTREICTSGRVTQTIHFDLLSGCLLVECRPLGRLPESVAEHPTFRRLLGKSIMSVIPASDPCMEYETRSSVHGWLLSFAMRGKSLVVRATRDDVRLELIPHEKFHDDLPLFLVDDCVHWLDLSSGDVELRPLASAWASNESNWRLTGVLTGRSLLSAQQLSGGMHFLIDPTSRTSSAVLSCLGVLELSKFFILTVRQDVLFIELPRLRLMFFMNHLGQLESCNFRDMIIDQDQCYGSLFGLCTQLVLCARDPLLRTLPRSRRVIIPDGTLDVKQSDNHVNVLIKVPDGLHRRIVPHVYVIDRDLRCLGDTSGTTSLLYKCLLHAMTSHCLPDTLTGYTGTEQALIDLCGARVKSFTQLSDRDLSLLQNIASITPARTFYPQHLFVMQDVVWDPLLPPLSQHAGYKLAADSILEFARELNAFRDPTLRDDDREGQTLDWSKVIISRDRRLLDRSLRRNTAVHALTIPFTDLHTCTRPSSCAHGTRCTCLDISYGHRHSASAELSIAELSRRLQAPAACSRSTVFDFLKMLEHHGKIGPLRSQFTLSYNALWLDPGFIGTDWFSLYQSCLDFHESTAQENRMQIVFSLCSMVFGNPELRPMAAALLALCVNSDIRTEPSPCQTPLNLRDGYRPIQSVLKDLIPKELNRDISKTPANTLQPVLPAESSKALKRRRKRYYQDGLENARARLVNILIDRWPRRDLQDIASSDIAERIDVQSALNIALLYFQSCDSNIIFANHVRRVQTLLRKDDALYARPTQCQEQLPSLVPLTSPAYCPTRSAVIILLSSLLHDRHTPSFPRRAEILSRSPIHVETVPNGEGTDKGTADLHALLCGLSEMTGADSLLNTYLDGLRSSVKYLDESTQSSALNLRSDEIPSSKVLSVERDIRARHVGSLLDILRNALAPLTVIDQQLDLAGLWPRVTERTVLQLLTFSQRETLPEDWTRLLSAYARAFLAYQRSQRLLEYSLRCRREDMLKELKNISLASPDIYDDPPDWLLVQIESNFLARPVQRTVARDMISPSSSYNSLQQLNMGEGKTSVIVPFVVTALARGDKLVRIVVLKALSNQMFSLLVDRLSGLAGRRVFIVPFSRGVPMTAEIVRRMETLYRECVYAGGVLVVQPEHILSFKLMVIDYVTTSSSKIQRNLATSLWKLQDWIDSHARDVLDESDELLHARYQLIYTVGLQQPLENHPYRWTTIQQVLLLLKGSVAALAGDFPESIHWHSTSDARFPFIRLLSSDVDDMLTNSVLERIMSGAIPDLHFSALPSSTRTAVADFIVAREPGDETSDLVHRELSDGDWKGVLLLRGLLAIGTGVLLYVLKQRRWRVDFGLDSKRSLLAVPYRAKDVPSLKAEFGHPDVAITLTCLSYYYGGLTHCQIAQCFARLFKMDDPQREYTEWVSVGGNDVPGIILQLSGVNLEDDKLVKTILVPTFSHNYAVVNFFLSQIVFPREAKEFPHKLGTSPWDLAERKPNVTTGFSGTKDNRFLLPTSISQKDLPEQRGTDALVLSHMLQLENTYAAHNGVQSGEGYLRSIVSQRPEIRVLLDVGAQMLDMKNKDLVKRWLELCDNSVHAAVFFTDADELAVLTRDGVVERLRSSSFSDQLDKCIVYLDDVHTRGTDLKLPVTYRAALTVGQKVTKDRLVQGAMRMRNLGYGQSVLILAPAEIDRAIRKAIHLNAAVDVGVCHVLQWAMLETCADITQHIPHWAEQGVDYERRRQGLIAYEKISDEDILRESWVRQEARNLDQMYGTTVSARETRELWENVQKHSDLVAHLATIGVTSIESARLAEEQEREVVLEVERERQIERPIRVAPAKHSLHPDIQAFVQSGHFPPYSSQFISLYSPARCEGDAWNTNLLATRDFAVTLATNTPTSSLHDYMRPMVWILSCGLGNRKSVMRLIAISPFEANELLPLLRDSTSGVHLHIFTPRLTKSMSSLSDLRFHVIPALPPRAKMVPNALQLQLALWSGELWLKDFAAYKLLCVLLGLYMGYEEDEIERLRDGRHIASDGFVRRSGRALVAVPSRFRESPVERLRELIGLRRKGMAYLSTHMGQILNARELEESAFDMPP